jgi:hypothetical protein
MLTFPVGVSPVEVVTVTGTLSEVEVTVSGKEGV